MASISQTIHQYTGGISQQPDEKKVPGQLADAINVLPDVTQGLLKRPGSELVASLSDHGTSTLNSNTNGRWFHYYRDESEQYIGQINRAGDVNMWRCSDGAVMTVSFESGQETAITNYLVHTKDEDIQTLTSKDFTFITNRTKATAMASTIEAARPNEVYVELNKIAYSRQYALNIYNDTTTQEVTTATRITVDLIASSNNYGGTSEEVVTRMAREHRARNYPTRTDSTAGTGEDSLCPNTGTKIFNVTAGESATDDAISGKHTYLHVVYNRNNLVDSGVTYTRTGATITVTKTGHGCVVDDYVDINFSGNATDGQYKIVSKTDDTFTFDDPYDTGTTTSAAASYIKGVKTGKENLYFQITNISQSIPQGAGSNVVYYGRYTTTHDMLFGGSGWQKEDYCYVWMKDGLYFVEIQEVSTAQVQANLGLIRPDPTPFDTDTTITSESVLGDLQQAIVNATGSPFSLNETKIIGNGIYLTDAASFNVATLDNDLINVVANEIQDIADLPSQCKHGFVCKIANTNATEDDYYVKFQGDNDRDGKGTWVECPEPGRRVAFDPATMPIQLVRQSNLTEFKLGQVAWNNCLCGSTVTVPKPSFISTAAGVDGDTTDDSRYINNMLFWRNRLVIISGENVILSRPEYFFDFWPVSSISYTVTDNIDLTVSAEEPAVLYDGVAANAGLVLFSKSHQFLLTTDSDILSPQTAKVNRLATYNFNYKTNPISLGTTIGFIDNAGKYSRFWEMANINRQTEPTVIDQSKVVSQLFNSDLDKMSNSRENSIVFFSAKNTNTLYGFRYFSSSDKRIQQAWFKWTFSGTIQHHAVLDDALYVIIRDDGKDTMQKIPIKMESDTNSITDDLDTTDTTDDITYRVHLDNSKVITASQLGYATSTGRTGFTKPDGFNSTTGQLVVYCHKADSTSSSSQTDQDSDLIGAYTTASVVGGNIEFEGDWTDHDIIVGYLFDMEVEFPTIYYTQVGNDTIQSDQSASLVVHRVKLSFGASGMYTTKLDRKGKPTYSETYEPPLADGYNANQVGINEQITKQIPVYEKNKNFTLTLTSSHPAPATLYSMTWEGLYNRPYYKSI